MIIQHLHVFVDEWHSSPVSASKRFKQMYNENSLPYAVRNSIKSIYYDYKTTDILELKVKNKTIYLVKITDTNTWKTVRVCNGDLEVLENYSTVISPSR